jgi:hypothetical protein
MLDKMDYKQKIPLSNLATHILDVRALIFVPSNLQCIKDVLTYIVYNYDCCYCIGASNEGLLQSYY